MSIIKKVSFVLVLFFSFIVSDGQEIPYNPVSYRIFSPFIFNPAIAGSKDFLSIDAIASLQTKSYSQIISANTRLLDKEPGYIISPNLRTFSNIGVGGAIFNDMHGSYRNIGAIAAGSYHLPLDRKDLSFLSLGISAKGIYYHSPGDSIPGIKEKNKIYPNFDAGIYFYNPSFFVGFSGTNLLGNPEDPDSLGVYSIPVSRQYYLYGGYKFVISRPFDIVIEPSVIINTGDTIHTGRDAITDMIQPMLKVYFGNFCLGTYFKGYDKIPFFFEFKYPRFYIGTFFQLPRNTPFYKKDITAEIVFGLNFANDNLGFGKNSHW